jgi:hypothetical protein
MAGLDISWLFGWQWWLRMMFVGYPQENPLKLNMFGVGLANHHVYHFSSLTPMSLQCICHKPEF